MLDNLTLGGKAPGCLWWTRVGSSWIVSFCAESCRCQTCPQMQGPGTSSCLSPGFQALVGSWWSSRWVTSCAWWSSATRGISPCSTGTCCWWSRRCRWGSASSSGSGGSPWLWGRCRSTEVWRRRSALERSRRRSCSHSLLKTRTLSGPPPWGPCKAWWNTLGRYHCGLLRQGLFHPLQKRRGYAALLRNPGKGSWLETPNVQDLWLEKLVAGLQDSWKLGLFMRGHTQAVFGPPMVRPIGVECHRRDSGQSAGVGDFDLLKQNNSTPNYSISN